MLLHQRANLPDQPINNNRRILICVSRPRVMKQTFDRHIEIMFDQPSQSGASFADERGFQNPGVCLQLSVPFFPTTSPPPPFFFLALVPFLSRTKPKILFLGLSFLRKQTETRATQAMQPYSVLLPAAGKGGERYEGHGLFITLEPLMKRPPKLHEIMYSTIPPV